MDAQILKVAGVALNAIGALILAIRVKKILDAVASVLHCHEANIQQLMKEITGRNPDDIYNFANSPFQLDKAQKIGVKLLVIAFILLFLGNVLTGLSVLMEFKETSPNKIVASPNQKAVLDCNIALPGHS